MPPFGQERAGRHDRVHVERFVRPTADELFVPANHFRYNGPIDATDQPRMSAATTTTLLATRVQSILATLRPAVQQDGGDLEFVGIDDHGIVSVRLRGACVGCPSSPITLKLGIERHLREKVPEVREVICV